MQGRIFGLDPRPSGDREDDDDDMFPAMAKHGSELEGDVRTTLEGGSC